MNLASEQKTIYFAQVIRFLIQLQKSSQNTTRKVYKFVPSQEWNKQWTDEELYKIYELNEDEICFINKIVRPMDNEDE